MHQKCLRIARKIVHQNFKFFQPCMTAHAIYDKCKSREPITTFNHIGACVSYRQVQKAKSELAQYTLMQCEKVLVPIPSNFYKGMFTIAAFDNFDHQDRS